LIDNIGGPGWMQLADDRYLYMINSSQSNSRLLCYDLIDGIIIADIALPCSVSYYPRICVYDSNTKRLFIGYGGSANPIRVIDADPQSVSFNQIIASIGNYLIEWAMILVNGYLYFCDNQQNIICKLIPSTYKVTQLATSIYSGTYYAFADDNNVYFTSSNGYIYTLPL